MVTLQKLDTLEKLNAVTRVEVIDEYGRSYVHYNASVVQYSIQDDGKTLKIFVKGNKSE